VSADKGGDRKKALLFLATPNGSTYDVILLSSRLGARRIRLQIEARDLLLLGRR
jgi:hypothetical protein